MIDRELSQPQRGADDLFFEDEDGGRWAIRPDVKVGPRYSTLYEVLPTSEREVGRIRVATGAQGRMTYHPRPHGTRLEAVFTKPSDAIKYLIGKSGGGD